MMMDDFDTDPYPGRPKILFIGVGGSTHTHAWIDLLSASDFNVRLFALPDGGIPPATWKIRTYLPQESHLLPEGLDFFTRKSLYPAPEILQKRRKKITFRLHALATKLLNFTARIASLPTLHYAQSYATVSGSMAESQENWLQLIVNQWQPDVIHTLGLDPAGYYYYRVRNHYGLKTGKWILQLRGGSDLALNRLIPETRARIMELIKESDQILSDNLQNVKYLREMNAREDQFSSLIPIPGTGGLDIGRLSALRVVNASQSREIVFPKGYELPWSKCLPVFEALKLCWDRIAPCKVHILNITPEIRSWFYSLPDPIRESCVLHDRIPRDDFFLLLARARILLIPSLVDGVPNSLYEAMALGVFPIVSPLETICSVVENGKNVLFARNLYPDEIGDALSQAMTDDALVERVVENNRELVAKIADREAMKIRVTAYYQKLSERILETK